MPDIEATRRSADHEQPEEDLKGPTQVDEGYELFDEAAAQELTTENSIAVRRKLDHHLLPLMCLAYGLNYVDKVAMGWAVLFNFREDLGLVGDEYSWASSMFYFGYLVAQYPANYILQRYKTATVISASIFTWGVLMVA
jgi:MFS transporter, ACS family, allantoate permease